MTASESDIVAVLRDYVSDITAKSIIAAASKWSKVNLRRLGPGDGSHFLSELEKGVQLYVKQPLRRRECMRRLSRLLQSSHDGPASSRGPRVIAIREESDIVTARGAARSVAGDLGFRPTIQIRIATAVSELARNIVQYAGSGQVTLTPIDARGRLAIEVLASDNGPGIANPNVVLDGKYRSRTGLGIGLRGTRSLMDEFDLDTSPGRGTKVRIRKYVE